jgi:hypothetical protein
MVKEITNWPMRAIQDSESGMYINAEDLTAWLRALGDEANIKAGVLRSSINQWVTTTLASEPKR